MKKIPIWAVALSIGTIVACTACAILFVIPFSQGYMQGSNPLPTSAPAAGPTPTIAHLEFEGEGNDIVTLDVPQSGPVIVSTVQVGEGYFSVWIKDHAAHPVDLIGNCMDDCQDRAFINLDAGQYILEVSSRASWAIVVTFP